MVKVRTLLAFLLCSMPLASTAKDVWSDEFEIQAIQGVASAGFVIIPRNAPIGGCAKFRAYQGRNRLDLDGVKMQMALALVAMTTSRPLAVFYNDTDSLCHLRYIEVIDGGAG